MLAPEHSELLVFRQVPLKGRKPAKNIYRSALPSNMEAQELLLDGFPLWKCSAVHQMLGSLPELRFGLDGYFLGVGPS